MHKYNVRKEKINREKIEASKIKKNKKLTEREGDGILQK